MLQKIFQKGPYFMREFLKRAKGGLSCFLFCVLRLNYFCQQHGVIDVIGTLLSVQWSSLELFIWEALFWALQHLEHQRLSEFWYLQLESGFSSSRRWLSAWFRLYWCRTCISWNSCGDGGCECQKIRIWKVGHGSCICYHLSGLWSGLCFLSAWSIETVYYAGRNRADYQRSAESVDCCHSNACSEGLTDGAQTVDTEFVGKSKVTVMRQMEFKMETSGTESK